MAHRAGRPAGWAEDTYAETFGEPTRALLEREAATRAAAAAPRPAAAPVAARDEDLDVGL
jgi:hypothetical protein